MELSLSDFVLFIVFGSCLMVLLMTAVSRWLHVRSERRAMARRVICRLCFHCFEDDSRAKVLECPDCHAATTRKLP